MYTNIMVSKGLGHNMRVYHVRSVMAMLGLKFVGASRVKGGTVLSFYGEYDDSSLRELGDGISEIVEEFL